MKRKEEILIQAEKDNDMLYDMDGPKRRIESPKLNKKILPLGSLDVTSIKLNSAPVSPSSPTTTPRASDFSSAFLHSAGNERRVPQSPNSPTVGRVSRVVTVKGPKGATGLLKLNIGAAVTSGDMGPRTSEASSGGMGTPKFHRRKDHGNPPATPVISHAPKISWFNHLFSNFKQGTIGIKIEGDSPKVQSKVLDLFEVLLIMVNNRPKELNI
jgi:hypothetical protein